MTEPPPGIVVRPILRANRIAGRESFVMQQEG
jgi:hypothetical protein